MTYFKYKIVKELDWDGKVDIKYNVNENDTLGESDS